MQSPVPPRERGRDAVGDSSRRGWFRRLGFAQQQLLVLAAAILPLLVLAAILLAWGVQEHRRSVERGLGDTAHALGIAVDEQIVTWRSALEALATSPALDEGDFAGFYDQAAAVAEQHQGGIVLFDSALRQRLNTRRPFGAPLPVAAYPDPVRRAFETGKPQVSGPFFGAVAKDWLISLDVPVDRDGRTLYSLNISFFPAEINRALTGGRLSGQRIVHIVNEEGRFVARSQDASEVIGKAVPAWYAEAVADGNSLIEGPSPAGGPEQVLALQPLHEAPWTLAVAASKAEVAGAWQGPLWLFGSIALLGILASAALAWLFSRRVTEPIWELADAAEDVLAGRHPKTDPLKIPELETLRQALERAALSARERIVAEERAAAAETVAVELRHSEERQTLLAQEVDHRSRNMLTVVQSILQQTRADDVESYVRAVSGRITALAQSHSLLAASRWRGADVARILGEELEPYCKDDGHGSRGARAEFDGPPVALAPAAAQSFAMAIHELTTNAVKYGALSCPAGRLSVAWRETEEGLLLTWTESGGPPGSGPPSRRGFGTRVVTAGIERQLCGRVTFDWRPEGLLVSILVPYRQLAGASEAGRNDDQSPTDAVAALDL